MGHLASFGSKRLVILRDGFVYDPDPNAAEAMEFHRIVGHDAYSETWAEGLDVFHNPHAKRPLDPWILQSAAHHRLREDGLLQSAAPDGHPVTSLTRILVFDSDDGARRGVDVLRENRTARPPDSQVTVDLES